jgi:hypothetical protein
MYVIKRNESEEMKMFNNDVRELAAFHWGLEDVRTVAVCSIFDTMGKDQALVLYCYLQDGSKSSWDDSYDEWDDADLEMGFDPYSGCYDFDC